MNNQIPISLAALVVLIAFEGRARADQCAWVDAEVAARARDILAKAPNMLAYCEPCGDAAPGVPTAPAAVEVRAPSHDYRELAIGGRGIDLAYTFVQTSASEYANLALLAGCPATGVSPTLQVARQTTNGVLITADPPPQVATPVVAVSAPVAPAAVAPPPHIYTYTTTRYELAWSVLAVAGAAGFAFGALATLLLLLATRRRRAMRPRATDLG